MITYYYFFFLRALTGKYPPKIRMYSKYERRTDTRTYEDRKKLYEGVSISHFITICDLKIHNSDKKKNHQN